MSLLHTTRHRLRMAEVLSGVPTSNELRKRVRASVSRLSRPPSLVVVLVGDRADSLHYINHKRRAAAECGIALRLVQLPTATRQGELHKALAAVNNDVTVDGVLLQLPLPPHLRARPALFHIHPGKDVDGLHPLNAGNLFLQDRSPLLHAVVQASSGSPQEAGAAASLVDTQALSMTHEMMLLSSNDGGYSAVRRRSHESKFFVPCTALAIRTMLFSHLSRTAAFAHLRQAAHSSDVSRTERSPASTAANAPESPQPSTHGTTATAAASHRELHAVIVNKSMVVGVPTAALLQRAGGFVVSLCSRSNSLETIRRLAQQADVLITGYGVANVFDRSFVRDGAIVIDAAVNELPGTGDAAHAVAGGGVCGDVDLASVSTVASAITKTPGGVGPLTVSHLMANVLKAYELRHANHLYYNNIYTEFLKMYGTYEKVRDYAPHLAAPRHGTAPTTTAAAPPPVAAVTPVDAVVPHVELNAMGDASSTHDGDHHSGSRADNDDVDDSRDGDLGDDTDADNESYSV